MSRASRRREHMSGMLGRLPPQQAGAIVVAGFISALMVIILDIALAAVLARSIQRGWRERQRGLASAVQAGSNPALIGLVGALAVHEVVRAVVFRAIIRPALTRSEPSPPLPPDRCRTFAGTRSQ